MEQFRFILLELFVIETNIARCLRINVVCQDGIRSKLTKTIKVQLPGETRKVAVLKVKRKNSACKFFHVLYDEIISRRRPSRDLLIASIDHVVGFWFGENREKMKFNVACKTIRKYDHRRRLYCKQTMITAAKNKRGVNQMWK